MAIYHLEMKVISRGAGRSACAASAYMSCSRVYNDYDGIQHDYARKQGLVWEQVFLPEHAPTAWQNREILWNAVEEAEKAKDSRLAREFVVALPVELGQDAWITLLTEFVQTQFVADGMCADVAIHAADAGNPHAHIMLTIRPLQENGSWQKKTEKEYLCMKDGIERGFTAAEYKAAQRDGWEKQYPYFVDKKKKEYLTPSVAEAAGYERVSKYPKSTKYGRQNPISARWNSEGQLLRWRENWADTVNRALEDHQLETRIDHRSFAARGITEQPTIHEGFIARAMEKQGIAADRCEINRQIRADNRLLRQLRQKAGKVSAAVSDRIPAIAEQLETIRSSITRLFYHRQVKENSIWVLQATIDQTAPTVNAYKDAGLQLARLKERRAALKQDKSETSLLNPRKLHQLRQKINTLTEDIEELESNRSQLIHRLDLHTPKEMSDTVQRLEQYRSQIDVLRNQRYELDVQISSEHARFQELKDSVAPKDEPELIRQRLPLRRNLQDSLSQSLKETFGTNFSFSVLDSAERHTDGLLQENSSLLKMRLQNLQKELDRNPEEPGHTAAHSLSRSRKHRDELEL